MGLWDFVKSAGKTLGIGAADAAEAPKAEDLKKEVESLGLDASGLKVEVDDGSDDGASRFDDDAGERREVQCHSVKVAP